MAESRAGSCPPRERILSLQGGCNFRDIGGYRTERGLSVGWGRVYRAGVLSYFTPQDDAPLSGLGLRAICDLRRAEERAREPTRWPGTSSHTTPAALCWDDGGTMPTIRGFAAARPADAAGMFDAMIDLYRALPEWMGGRIRGLFECIAQGDVPLVVHCAAGKDRTGIAIAVLLQAVGVPRETVLEDYLLTNEAGNFEQFILSRQESQLGVTDAHHPLLAMPEDVRRVLFSADKAFLDAAFERIDALGGLDVYLEQTAGVSAPVRERVSQALLE
jgi:protein-tyrosine phosphatase